MRIAAVSDVHAWNHRKMGGPVEAGVNRRCRHVTDALAAACVVAKKEADVLLVNGDVFDGVRPEPQVISAVADALELGPETWLLKGNHDSASDTPGDNALGPLASLSNVHAVDCPTRTPDGICLLPFRSGRPATWMEQAIAQLEKTGPMHAVAVHLGLSDERTAAFLRGATDSIGAAELADVMRKHGMTTGFAGNWHDEKDWDLGDVSLWQVGALAPTGFDNPGPNYGRVVIYDTEAGGVGELRVPGPRFLKLDARETFTPKLIVALVAEKCSVYVSVKTDLERFQKAEEILKACLDAGAVDGEISLDNVEAETAARDAAHAARSSSTAEEALVGYVKEMQLDDGVDREEVLAAARRYMNGGKR